LSGAEPSYRARWIATLHRYPLLALLVGAAIGILLSQQVLATRELDRQYPLSATDRAWVMSLVFFWLGVFFVLGLVTWKLPPRWRLVASMFVGMPLFAIRHTLVVIDQRSASILEIVSTESAPVVIEGTIDRTVVLRPHPRVTQAGRRDQSPWQSVAEIHIESARVGRQPQPFHGRALVTIDGKLDHFLPGDRVQVFGWASRFLPPSNPGERDLRAVYQRRGVHIRVDVDSTHQWVRAASPDSSAIKPPWWMVHRMIARIANHSRDILLQQTDSSTGPLAVALVIGQRDFVDNPTRDSLLVTGTAHLLSVSGLHLAIIVILASGIASVFRFPMLVRVGWILGVCLLFTAITGGRPPVMRACLLVAAVMLSLTIRRPGQPLNSLGLAGLVLLVINPSLLMSVGVQLSFLAVATLLICGRRSAGRGVTRAKLHEQRLDELVRSSRPAVVRGVRFVAHAVGQMIWYSGCVSAMSMPLVWHQFHVVSLISVLVNVLMWPLLFVSLASGVATVMSGWLYEPLAGVPGWVCHTSIAAMREVIETASRVPGGHLWLPSPPTWLVIVFYLGMLMLILWRPTQHGLLLRCGWIVSWGAIALSIATRPAPLPPDTIEAIFIDVGHGTSVALRWSDDDVWLYDCGRLGNDNGSSRDIDDVLWSLGVTELTAIMLSHADADHFNALPGVLQRFRVRSIITPPGMFAQNKPALVASREAIRAGHIPIHEVAAGEELLTTLAQPIRVLHPPAERIAGNDNANSLVVRIDHGGKTLILPGDLEPPGTAVMVNHPRPPPGGVLMAPHHGSLSMDAETVLQWARPRETIVSGGRRAARPEVEQMLSAAGSNVYVTAKHGAIRVRIDQAGNIQIHTWTMDGWRATVKYPSHQLQ